MEFTVTPSGTVTDIRAVGNNHPDLVDAARKALEKWEYKPGIKDGKAVPSRVRQPLIFELR